MPVTDPAKKPLSFGGYYWRLTGYVFIAALLITCLCFSAFYISEGYEGLRSWFFSLNDCFYRRDQWATDFFTPEVKRQGNYFAAAAGICCITGLPYLWHSWKKYKALISVSKDHNLLLSWSWWYPVIVVLAILFWRFGESKVVASFDEISSGLNCSKIHAFQTLAYYMLPNNHIYFNFLNKIPSHWIKDPVWSGKMISGLAYCMVLCCVFNWFAKVLDNCIWAILAILPVALQFITWGFSFQSRGYELELLCGWLCFITLLRYLKQSDVTTLQINTFFGIAGVAIIPSFLYYYLAQVIFLIICKRRLQCTFWKYQLFFGIAVFLCYLPGLCFSGIHAFIGNRYVISNIKVESSFLSSVIGEMKYHIDVCFSLSGGNYHLNPVLIFLPLLLLFMRSKEKKLLGGFYLIMWLSFLAVAMCMRRLPFSRNMNVQFSLTMAYVIYTFYSLVRLITNTIKANLIRQGIMGFVFSLPIIVYAHKLYKDDLSTVSYNLYGYDLNQMYDQFKNNVAIIPRNSSIGFSDESFYWRYHCGKMGYRTSACANGDEDYYVIRDPDKLPAGIATHYELIKNCEDYEIYKRH